MLPEYFEYITWTTFMVFFGPFWSLTNMFFFLNEHPLIQNSSLICTHFAFPAFSSLAVSTANNADSRGSLISIESNPSNSDRNSEKMDGCEKVSNYMTFLQSLSLIHLY